MHGARTTGLFLQEVMIVKHKVPETKMLQGMCQSSHREDQSKNGGAEGTRTLGLRRDRPAL